MYVCVDIYMYVYITYIYRHTHNKMSFQLCGVYQKFLVFGLPIHDFYFIYKFFLI